MSKWENGDATPDLDNLIQLAEYLKVSLDELVLGKPEEVRIERVVEKSERPMNVWEFLDKNSEMSKRDFLFILVFFILFFGGFAVVHYFSK
ncbi:helix-turn-helix domain-containing protein [Streptococcus cuniculi]|uniref:helix-turn-helix domain-containing protein n=1 Tax=Streptococcus cuniculi TaxID=1432788 RepID=UPI003A0FF738